MSENEEQEKAALTANIITVNGIEYQEIKRVDRKPYSSTLSAYLMASLLMYGGLSRAPSRKKDSEVNIVSEFGLIQQKKSKLSKSERDRVVRSFNHYFKPVNKQSILDTEIKLK